MQDTSELYRQIYNSQEYYVETRAAIGTDDVEQGYDETMLVSVKTKRRAFKNNRPEVGCCVCGEIDIEMYMPPETIERTAKISLFIRLVSTEDGSVSEWIPKGVYYVDTRDNSHNNDDLDILTIHGYDAMMRAEKLYGSTTLSFPATALNVARDIASQMGVTLDPRCVAYFDKTYNIQFPSNYTLRETLGYIGTMYGANWAMTDDGQLTMIPLWALPPETSILTDDLGNRLVFGVPPEEEVRILV